MFNFHNLELPVRHLMLDAINESEAKDKLYHSSYFKTSPNPIYVGLLKQAAIGYNEVWLQNELNRNNLFLSQTTVRMKSGKTYQKSVPDTAAQTFADGQFNRYYMQGLCRYARTQGLTMLEVYRAQQRTNPRPESLRLEGTHIHVDDLELQLLEPDCYLTSDFLQPNSGLSVRM